jgi:hypothetical protein
LPDCATIVTAAPEGWAVAHADDAPEVWGITWKPKGNFQNGDFAVTLAGSAGPGTVNVATQAPKLAAGVITGPSCT